MTTIQNTNIIKGFREKGATFYTFSSSINDTLLLFSNSNMQLSFSKFACLKLPDFENTTKQRLYVNPDDIKSINDETVNKDANTFVPKALIQNYIENFNNIIDANRADDNLSNFSESAFFKALQSVSDHDKDLSTTADNTIQLDVESQYLGADGQTHDKYKEIDSSNDYENVIKYVGDINMLNHVKSEGKEYLEIFAHIPTNSGAMEKILLKRNFSLQPNLSQVPENGGDVWVTGREDEYNNSDVSEETFLKALYDTTDRKYNVSSDKDMLGIDWDDIENDKTKHDKGSFEYNAILLYYDIFDKNDLSTKRRNLYGILFLNRYEKTSVVTEKIPTLTKYQPDSDQAGNSFGVSLKLQLSNNTSQVTSVVSVNSDSSVSMELYMKALEQLQIVTDQYNKLTPLVYDLQEKVNQMHLNILGVTSSIATNDDIDNLQQQINDLKGTN